MTTPLLIVESSTLFATACASLWKLNEMEKAAKHDKHSALAFFFVLAWGALAIWSLKLSLMTFIAEQINGILGVAGTLFILTVLSFSARSAKLFDTTLGKDDHKIDAHAPINTVTSATIANTNNICACERRDIIEENKLDSVRVPVGDTDEYFFPADS